MRICERILLISACAVLVLCGCQGPETRVLPRQNVSQEQPYELTGQDTVLEEANPFYLQEALDFLSSAPRVCGSAQETNAAEYIKRLLIDYGYDVTIQRFPLTSETGGVPLYGTNVIAVKASFESEGDILLVTTSHDSVEGSPGANDNTSGAVAFLETARLIAKMPTDTEIRFISFSGTGHRRQGVRHYMELVTREERERMIGAIHLDTLGYIYDDQIVMSTTDGYPTLLGSLLAETTDAEGWRWGYQEDDRGGYTVFDRYRIPAVRVTQRVTAFEQGTPQDRSDIVDVEKIGKVSQVLSQTLVKIMQEDTPSYLKASQAGDYYRDGALFQRTNRGIPFGETRESVEYYYGSPGNVLESADTDGEWYQYPMKWLEVDQIIMSDFLYLDGVLVKVALKAQESGIEYEEMMQRLTRLYGEPVTAESGTELIWHDFAGNMNFSIKELTEGYQLEVGADSVNEHLLATYPVNESAREGQESEAGQEPEIPARDRAILALVETVFLPEEREKITDIVLFTDGTGGKQIYWSGREDTGEQEDSTAEEEAPEGYVLYIDREDVTDSEGGYRDYNDSLRQLVRAMAYLYQEPYGGLFYEKFDKTIGDEFDAAFQAFVLTNRPESDMLDADKRVLFFYQFEPLLAVRSEIRRQIDLPL